MSSLSECVYIARQQCVLFPPTSGKRGEQSSTKDDKDRAQPNQYDENLISSPLKGYETRIFLQTAAFFIGLLSLSPDGLKKQISMNSSGVNTLGIKINL